MTKSPSILIVDDEIDLRLTLKEAFEYFGWVVDEAENGQTAFHKILANRYDSILSDIKMPITNGIDFLKLLTPDFKNRTPIFMISAYSDYNERTILDLGARKLLAKPMSIMDLFGEIDAHQKKVS